MSNQELREAIEELGFGEPQPQPHPRHGHYIPAIDAHMNDDVDEEDEEDEPAVEGPPVNLQSHCSNGRPRCQSRRQDQYQCTHPQHRLHAPRCKRHHIIHHTNNRRAEANNERDQNDEADSEVKANKRIEERIKKQLDRYNLIFQNSQRVGQRRLNNDQLLRQQRQQREQVRNYLRVNNQPANIVNQPVNNNNNQPA